jgi:hypothetical protein
MRHLQSNPISSTIPDSGHAPDLRKEKKRFSCTRRTKERELSQGESAGTETRSAAASNNYSILLFLPEKRSQ